MPIEYKFGKVYKVRGPIIPGQDAPKCYIGSTADKLSSRINGHRNAYRTFLKTNKGRCTIFELFEEYGLENCKIELIENYPCDTVDQLKRREGEIQEQTDNRVNHNIAGRTLKETYQASNAKNLIVSICECGGKMSNINKKKHFRSIKHLNFIKFKEEEKQFIIDEIDQASDTAETILCQLIN